VDEGTAIRPEGGIARKAAVTSVAAAAAIASGLLLDVSIAYRFGAGSATDAFFVGARIPLGLLAVVMVAANQTLVPAFSAWRTTKAEDESRRLTSLVLTGVFLIAGVIAVSGSSLAAPLVHLTAPGLSDESTALAISVARIMFFLLPLVSMAEVLRAVLNSRRAFTAPAAVHLLFNGTAAGIVIASGARSVHVVAWAYLAGSVIQFLFLAVTAQRRGFRYKPSLQLGDPQLHATLALTVRPLFAAGLNPLARVAELAVVSFLPPGSITILNYGYRLVSAIGGSVFFRSVIVVIVPSLTDATVRDDRREIRRLTGLGLRIMLLLSVPLTAFLAVLAGPAVRVLFQRGSFSADSSALLGTVLAVYAGSLIGSGVQRALLAPFFARLDTKTPLRNTVYGVGSNILMLTGAFALRHDADRAVIAVALAYSLSQYVHVAHVYYRLRQTLGEPISDIGRLLGHLVGTSLATAAVMTILADRLQLTGPASTAVLLGRSTVVALIGLIFLGCCLIRLHGSDGLRRLLRGAPLLHVASLNSATGQEATSMAGPPPRRRRR
jgi:putative peptidoglycan lipid II flippase